jgi:hypothetical protein
LYLVIFYLALAGGAFGQDTSRQEKKRVVIIPPEVTLPAIAYQPDCPLQIEDITVFINLSRGGVAAGYKVRNKGAKPIRSYTIGVWNTVGTGWELGGRPKGNILPGQVYAPDEEVEVEVVGLTESLRKQLDLREGMNAVLVFMIARVEYADGSTYTSEPSYKALKAHLDDIAK